MIKDREALAALDPFGDTMLMTTLHWPDEIRSTAELDLRRRGLRLQAGRARDGPQLVSAMTGEFDPAQYKDEYREALETIIQAKVEGKETVEIEAPEESGKLIDLMAALEASVNAAKAARDGKRGEAGVGGRREGRQGGQGCQDDQGQDRRRRRAEDAEAEAPAKPARKRKTA